MIKHNNSAAASENSKPQCTEEKLSNHEVTAHTAGLWRYNPIPESPEPYPEYRNCYKKTDTAEIIAARVRGKKHKHDGTNCDDWFEFDTLGDWILAAVSDGAGSKAFSRIGAKASCETVVNYLKSEYLSVLEEFPDLKKSLGLPLEDAAFTEACSRLAAVMQNSVVMANEAVQKAFDERRENEEFAKALKRTPEYKDFSATLLAAAVIPVQVSGGKEHLIISVQIGDGMIASINRDSDFSGALRLLGDADAGAFAGETDFLTSQQNRLTESLMKRTKIQRRKITSVMLMTDGVADDYYPNNPQLLRLYLDLMLNGIIEIEGSANEVTEANRRFISNVPEPLEYPWVNDGDVKFPIQYTNNIISNADITLEELWKNTDVLRIASLKSFDKSLDGSDSSEKLMTWLDNYVERGSFDDRTLIIINVGGAV